MAVTLEITFVGLFTFVQRDELTHVLMPQTAGHEHHGMQRHEARLYLGRTSLEGGAVPVPWSLPLERTILRISDRNRAKGVPSLPATLFDLSSITERPVAADVFGEVPNWHRVSARADLDMHGTPEGVPPFGAFLLKDEPQNAAEAGQAIVLASYARWTESIEDADLQITLMRLAGDGAGLPFDLTPALLPLGTDRLALTVYHVVPSELPPAVPTPAEAGKRVDHWGATYELFDAPVRRPMPVFDKQALNKGIVPNTCGGTSAQSS
jgi:hypothetical protein